MGFKGDYKKDPKSIFEFLQKWTKVDDKNTKWIIKEGMKKLSEKKQEELKSLAKSSTKSTNKCSENLVAYCGLYCGDCFFYKGEIAKLAKDLRKKLREAKLHKTYKEFSKFAKEFKNYPVCYDVLGAMVKMRCKGCRNGGGPPFCKIRKCCQKKGIEGCWECDKFETCKKLDFLKPNHGNAHLRNLRKIKKCGKESFLKGKRYW